LVHVGEEPDANLPHTVNLVSNKPNQYISEMSRRISLLGDCPAW
jgi:hypothetical protein